MITTEKKQKIVADLSAHKTDTGSSAVVAAIMTERIKELTAHLKTHKQDHAARRGLLQLVGKRKKHLQYIADNDAEAYHELIKKLGIRR